MEQIQIEATAADEARAEFTIEPTALHKAARFLRMRIAAKLRRHEREGAKLIAASVRVTAQPCGLVTIEASNCGYEGATVSLAADEVLQPGAFVVPADTLEAAAKRAGKGRDLVTLADDGERVAFKAGRTRIFLKRRKADCLHPHPTGGTESTLSAEFSLPLSQFVADVRSLSPAVGTDEKRDWLQAIAMQRRDMAGQERLVLLATDGKVAAFSSRPLPAGAESLADWTIPTAIIPALMDMDKLSDGEAVRVSIEGSKYCAAITFAADGVSVSTIAGTADFPDIMGAIGNAMGEAGEQAPLFPELLPGAPTSDMEKLAKKTRGAISWEHCGELMVGAHEDPGLFFGVMRMTDADATGKKGYHYRGADGESGEIIGPDGVTYPVPFRDNGKSIGFTAAQVRDLIGDDIFDVLEFPGPDGKPRYVSQWLWEQGDTSFLTVQANGRTFPEEATGNWHYRSLAERFTREEIEAALAPTVEMEGEGEPYGPPAPAQEPQDCETVTEQAPEPAEPENAPSGQEMDTQGDDMPADDPLADVLARLEAIEATLAALPAESVDTPTGDIKPKRTPAHERAIRRAWAERREARAMRSLADYRKERRDEAVRKAARYRGKAQNQEQRRIAAAMDADRHRAYFSEAGRRIDRLKLVNAGRKAQVRKLSYVAGERLKHLREMSAAKIESDKAARDNLSRAQRAEQAQHERAKELIAMEAQRDHARAERDRLKRDMADPSQPERASDIARLVVERDQARAAIPALQQRAERAEAALQDTADKLEGMATRVYAAERKIAQLAA